jgi:hypothetical protein
MLESERRRFHGCVSENAANEWSWHTDYRTQGECKTKREAQDQVEFRRKEKLGLRFTLPRYWKRAISQLTGLQFCDRSCECGKNNQLWWFPMGRCESVPSWVPGWMNGADTQSVWKWLVKNGRNKVTK